MANQKLLNHVDRSKMQLELTASGTMKFLIPRMNGPLKDGVWKLKPQSTPAEKLGQEKMQVGGSGATETKTSMNDFLIK